MRFEFDSDFVRTLQPTDPEVFSVTLETREGFEGVFATAEFRRGHVQGLHSVTAWSSDEAGAKVALRNVLKKFFSLL